jgi:hypothetical protein
LKVYELVATFVGTLVDEPDAELVHVSEVL